MNELSVNSMLVIFAPSGHAPRSCGELTMVAALQSNGTNRNETTDELRAGHGVGVVRRAHAQVMHAVDRQVRVHTRAGLVRLLADVGHERQVRKRLGVRDLEAVGQRAGRPGPRDVARDDQCLPVQCAAVRRGDDARCLENNFGSHVESLRPAV